MTYRNNSDIKSRSHLRPVFIVDTGLKLGTITATYGAYSIYPVFLVTSRKRLCDVSRILGIELQIVTYLPDSTVSTILNIGSDKYNRSNTYLISGFFKGSLPGFKEYLKTHLHKTNSTFYRELFDSFLANSDTISSFPSWKISWYN